MKGLLSVPNIDSTLAKTMLSKGDMNDSASRSDAFL